MASFNLSEDRIVSVKEVKGERIVVLKQKDSDVKFAEFTKNRWAQFKVCLEDIEEAVVKLRAGEPITFKRGIGSGYYVSVTKGFYCIDVRRFFLPHGETEAKPSRQGLALRVREWEDWKRIITKIDELYADFATALPCYYGEDHQNQIGALQCRDCSPFSWDMW